MKLLRIYKDGLELESLVLHRPHHLIGRSPHCDMVLRARGVRSVHFIVEWLGSSTFDPEQGQWTIFEVKESHADNTNLGFVLQPGSNEIGELDCKLEEARLEATPNIGGGLKESLTQRESQTATDCVEVLQLHAATGSLEKIFHFKKFSYLGESFVPCSEVPEFNVTWVDEKPEAVKVSIDNLDNQFHVFVGLREETAVKPFSIRANDLLRLEGRSKMIFLRFIESADVVPIPKDYFGDRTIKSLFLFLFLPLLVGLAAMFIFEPYTPPPPEIEENIERIIRVEIVKPAPPEPEPPKVEIVNSGEETAPQKVAQKSDPVSATVPTEKRPPKIALTKKAPVKKVTQLGVLGLLSKSTPGPGVRPDKIKAQDLVSDMPNANNPSIILKSNPTGKIGTGDSGSNNANSKDLIDSASTQLQGGKYDPKKSSSLVTTGSGVGNSLNSIGGSSSGPPGFASGDLGAVRVEGGLSRETVRRVVRSYQGQIQTCYERVLVKNPNLSGRFVFDWNITPTGPVATVKSVKETVKSPELTTCLLGLIKRMVFPKAENGKSTRVIYPFEFKSAGR